MPRGAILSASKISLCLYVILSVSEISLCLYVILSASEISLHLYVILSVSEISHDLSNKAYAPSALRWDPSLLLFGT